MRVSRIATCPRNWNYTGIPVPVKNGSPINLGGEGEGVNSIHCHSSPDQEPCLGLIDRWEKGEISKTMWFVTFTQSEPRHVSTSDPKVGASHPVNKSPCPIDREGITLTIIAWSDLWRQHIDVLQTVQPCVLWEVHNTAIENC